MRRFLYNCTPFKVSVLGKTILPNFGDMLDDADPSVARMISVGILSENRAQKVEQDLTVSAISSDIKHIAIEEKNDGISTTREPSEVCFPGSAIYEGLPRVEPINRRGGNKRPSDSMGSY
jgi:hypothetical protein